MDKNKRIRYKHIHALRDLSKCFNFNGVKIKKGVFFRSGYLGKLSAIEAKEFVDAFNIGYIIDLRTDEEKNVAPDMLIEGVKYYHVPILSSFDNPLITKENRSKILVDIAKNRGGSISYLSRVYRKMVSDDYSLNQIKQIFELIANKDDDKAIIFHCTQGKDRTGVVAALILYALGVDRASILNDYVRFNNAYRFKNFLISFLVAFRFFSFKISRDLYYLQMAHKKLIQATFDEIKKKYSNRYEFFEHELDLNKDQLEKIRDKYLIKE